MPILKVTLLLLGRGDFPSSNSLCETDVQTQEETGGHLIHESNRVAQAEKPREASGDLPKTAHLVMGTT